MSDTRAEVVLSGAELEATMAFFTELGFRLVMIAPADAPMVAVMEGHGLTIRCGGTAGPDTGAAVLRLPLEAVPAEGLSTEGLSTEGQSVGGLSVGGSLVERRLVAPNGTIIELVSSDPALVLPPLVPSFTIDRAEGAEWHPGRAGMGYRDLIADRQGGRFIASHISIPNGGPVPDYVHHHHIRFQMIFCRRGWAKLVYQDQGEPFLLNAGNCVIQPPHIRHQVLETSDAFEVVEVGTPAVHETRVDHQMTLPNTDGPVDTVFGGQHFVHHQRQGASWTPWRFDGLVAREFGFDAATDGLAEARVVRPDPDSEGGGGSFAHDGEFVFWFMVDGKAGLERSGEHHQLGPGDAVTLPAGEAFKLHDLSSDFELLEVTLPATA